MLSRVVASAAAAFCAVASVLLEGLGPRFLANNDGTMNFWVPPLVASGAALASWLVFPALGRPGPEGLLRDVALVGFAVGLAGAIVGTMSVPFIGTVAGIGVAFALPFHSGPVAAIYLAGFIFALSLARWTSAKQN